MSLPQMSHVGILSWICTSKTTSSLLILVLNGVILFPRLTSVVEARRSLLTKPQELDLQHP
jgi:hypothetical protein